MVNTFIIANCFLALLGLTPLQAQNTITAVQAQNFQSFIRISVQMSDAPKYHIQPAPAARQSIRGELQFIFSNAALSGSVSSPRDSSVHVELSTGAADESVVLRIRLESAFRYNAFYYSPQHLFIVDVVLDLVQAKAAPFITPIEQAKKALVRRDSSEALTILQRIIAASPMDAPANYYIGLIRLARRDFEMARQNFLRACTSDSTFHKRADKKIAAIDKYLLSTALQAVIMDTTLDDDQEKIILRELADNATMPFHQLAGGDSSDREIIIPEKANLVKIDSTLKAVTESTMHGDMRSPTAKFWWEYAASFTDFSTWKDWIARQRGTLKGLSAIFAVLGILLLVTHLWSVRKSRRQEEKKSPEKFDALLNNRPQAAPAPFLDLISEQLPGDLTSVNQPKENYIEPPFRLPAPLPEAMVNISSAMTKLSAQELSDDHLDSIAQRLKVGRGELELYLYMSKRDATSRTSSNQPRLTMVEVE